MSRVRLRLAGASMFSARVLGSITGLLFSLVVTRRLSEEELGMWRYISLLVAYAILPNSFIKGWIARDSARGRPVLGPAITFSMPLLITSLAIYFLISGALGAPVGASSDVLLAAALYLVPLFMTQILASVVSGYAPQRLGVASMLLDVSKLGLAAYLVAYLRLSLLGVFTSLAIAQTIHALYLAAASRHAFSEWIDAGLMRRWVKGAPFSSLPILLGLLGSVDTLAMSLITGSTLITGFWQAVLIVGVMAYAPAELAAGLGPRLLGGGGERDVGKTLQFTMMIALPALIGLVILSRDILWILRPSYADAWLAAVILSISNFVRIFTYVAAIVMLGTDTFDAVGDPTLMDYLNSRVFKLSIVWAAISGLYGGSIAAATFLSLSSHLSPAEVVLIYALINLSVQFISLSIHMRYMEAATRIRLSLVELRDFLVSASFMALALLSLRILIGPLQGSIYEAAAILVVYVAVGLSVYFGVLWLISERFRSFVRDVRAFLGNLTAGSP